MPQVRRVIPIVPLMPIFMLAFGGVAGAQQPPGGADAPPPAVTVEPAREADIKPQTEFSGRVEAVDKVELRARVEGFLEARLFEEGAEVEKGQKLFTIEKGPYEASLAEAQAALASARADYDLAQQEQKRQKELVSRRAVAQAQLDQANAQLAGAEAAIKSREAALRTAQLNVSYTDIKAPIDGKIGRAAYSVGDLVGPSSGPLATIVSQDPIYATFTITQRQLLQARQEMRDEGVDPSRFTIRLRLADGSLYDKTGTIGFIGNQVDPNTDSLTVRAKLPNPDGDLIDGQLVQVIAETEKASQVLVVPQKAVGLDQIGRYVLTVGKDDTVAQTRVEVGETTGPDVIVTKGLKPGDLVITEGLQKARPGSKVNPTRKGETPAAATGAGQKKPSAGGASAAEG
ncbi:MAG: efflux RND transporter periplasmic adaptor subunit [Geminicoccaceae bacterium]|nr:efflux RND transporter periplasmic adaptor subunit [Geminicoccaceae bacterium]